MAELSTVEPKLVSDWIDGDGVTSVELRQSWARYELWMGNRCITQVEDGAGSVRRSVFSALYPLAEWIAENWWALTHEVRPSATPYGAWRWANVRQEPWLRRHNLRAAGDGMAWPDLTVVPEGSATRLIWHGDEFSSPRGRVTFTGTGQALVASSAFLALLNDIVERVLTRLDESATHGTPLEREWAAIHQTDEDETAFCSAAARLGLDPYTIDEATSELLVLLGDQLPSDVLSDFLDSVDVENMNAAAAWVRRAEEAAARALTTRPAEPVSALQAAVAQLDSHANGWPWTVGYAMARRVREVIDADDMAQVDCSRWITKASSSSEAHGLQGLGARTNAHCAVILPPRTTRTSGVFSQARALGRTLARPQATQFILSRARADDEKLARAFAAELLAPAEGISRYLDRLGSADDAAMEAIANRYGVSPLLVRHQYENQILERADLVF